MNPPAERKVHLSGELVPESAARISIFDSAILLGDCVTESTRTFRHLRLFAQRLQLRAGIAQDLMDLSFLIGAELQRCRSA